MQLQEIELFAIISFLLHNIMIHFSALPIVFTVCTCEVIM